MTRKFDIYIPATPLAEALFVKTIDIEVFNYTSPTVESEEFVAHHSRALIDEEQAKAIFEHSLALAERLHEGQFRRDGKTPYFEHVLSVVSRVHTWEQKTIAALHDTIEDKRASEEDLSRNNIPSRIIRDVCRLDFNNFDSYETGIEFIKDIGGDVKIVKIADIISNLSDSPTEKQVRKYVKALDVLLCSK